MYSHEGPWDQPQQQRSPSVSSFSVGRTSLRFAAISSTSFTVAVLAQSVPASLAWPLLFLGGAAWVASTGAAIIKKGDDSWAMVGVTASGLLGAGIGVGEILQRLPWPELALPISLVLSALLALVMIERVISRRGRREESISEHY